MNRPEALVRRVGRVRAVVVAVLASAALSVAAGPGIAKGQGMVQHISLFALADDTFEVQSAHGVLTLPPEIAPPSHRAWRLGDDPGPVVDGRLVHGQVFVDRVVTDFYPVRQRARGEPARVPGVVTVMVLPDDPATPCDSGRGSPTTAEIAYDPGDGRVVTLPLIVVYMACRVHDLDGDGVADATDYVSWRRNPIP